MTICLLAGHAFDARMLVSSHPKVLGNLKYDFGTELILSLFLAYFLSL